MKKLIYILAILGLAFNVGAETWTTAKTGTDGASCVTDPPTTDCLTIQYIFTNVDLAPSDIIEVHAGTYAERVTWGADDDGDVTGYVTLQGRAGEIVIIDAEDTENFAVDFNRNTYCKLKNIRAIRGVLANISMNATNATDSVNLVLEDVITYDVSAGANHHNVALKGSDVTLTRVTSYDSDQDCFHSNGDGYVYNDVLAYNCDLQDTAGDVIYHIGGSLTVTGSTLTKETDNKTIIRHSATTGIAIITGNTVTSTAASGLLTINGGVNGHVVSGNEFVGGDYGIYFDTAADSNGTISNNLFSGQDTAAIYFINGAASTWGLYNNSIYSDFPLRVGDAATVNAENNIFYNTDTSGYLVFVHATGTYTGDTNIFYPEATSFMAYQGSVEDDLAGWRIASSQDANSLNSDPQFANAAGGNFRLKFGSPAIGAADTLADAYKIDIVGRNRNAYPPWDIGAYMHLSYEIKSVARMGMQVK